MDPLLSFFTILGGVVALGSLAAPLTRWIMSRREERRRVRQEARARVRRRQDLMFLRMRLLAARDEATLEEIHAEIQEILTGHPEDAEVLQFNALVQQGLRGHEEYQQEKGEPLRSASLLDLLLQTGITIGRVSPAAGCLFWSAAGLVALALLVSCPR